MRVPGTVWHDRRAMSTPTSFLEGATAWLYGAPDTTTCPTCGFDWDEDAQAALAQLRHAPERYATLLEGRDGTAAVAAGWTATGYVWHLADLARGWSERWVVLADGPGALLAGWDPDELAAARNYAGMPTVSALWALRQGIDTLTTLTAGLDLDTPFEHGDWGTGDVAQALVWIAHEMVHHELDVDERAGR
jgi:hypothetical protein